MKKILSIIFSVILIFSFTFAQDTTTVDEEQAGIEIVENVGNIAVGDTADFDIIYQDSLGNQVDTTAEQWIITPDSLGEFGEQGLFIATEEGEGSITAVLGDYSDSVEVEIFTPQKDTVDEEQEEAEFVISPQTEKIQVGDTIEFNLSYFDTAGTKIDTTAGNWSVNPDSLGTFTENEFIAKKHGEGEIVAELDSSTTTSIEIEVEAKQEQDKEQEEEKELNRNFVISPKDTIVNINNDVDFNLSYQTDSTLIDTTADNWYLDGMNIGTIDKEGLLSADSAGYAVVKAEVGDQVQTGLVIVQDAANDDTINTVSIQVPHPAPHKDIKDMGTIEEGQAWKIGGLKPPMHIYNGGMIYFPIGSLDEDVTIRINIPEDFATVNKDKDTTVSFVKSEFVSAIEFNVYVDDSLQEPYYFNNDLIVGLVYKRGLLDQLGLDPNSLRLRYANQDGDSIQTTSEGLGKPTRDLYKNRIFSSVEHFSTLVIEGESQTTGLAEGNSSSTEANDFKLKQNYPNPFNPTTNIEFRMPSSQNVQLTIYNVLGQKVATLLQNNMSAGTHTVKWNAGNLPSGIYLIRLKAGKYNSVQKAVLTK